VRWILLIILVLNSCTTQKRCLQKFPPIVGVDTIIYTTTVYRDTVILRYLPGDTVFSHSIEKVPVRAAIRPVEAETSLAYARAWISEKRLRLMLIQKDSVFRFKLDSAIRANERIEYITEIKTHQLPPKPFYKRGFFILAGVLLLFFILIVRKMF